MSARTEQGGDPESYIRINVAQNSKGHTFETTVSLRWTFGDLTDAQAEQRLAHLLQAARTLAEQEIRTREAAG